MFSFYLSSHLAPESEQLDSKRGEYSPGKLTVKLSGSVVVYIYICICNVFLLEINEYRMMSIIHYYQLKCFDIEGLAWFSLHHVFFEDLKNVNQEYLESLARQAGEREESAVEEFI